MSEPKPCGCGVRERIKKRIETEKRLQAECGPSMVSEVVVTALEGLLRTSDPCPNAAIAARAREVDTAVRWLRRSAERACCSRLQAALRLKPSASTATSRADSLMTSDSRNQRMLSGAYPKTGARRFL